MAKFPEMSTRALDKNPDNFLTPLQQFTVDRLSEIKGRLEELMENNPRDEQGQMLLKLGIFALRRDLIEYEGFTPKRIDSLTANKTSKKATNSK